MKRLFAPIIVLVCVGLALAVAFTDYNSTSMSATKVNTTVDTISGVGQLIRMNDPTNQDKNPTYRSAQIYAHATLDTSSDVSGVGGCWGAATDSAVPLLYGVIDPGKVLITKGTATAMTKAAGATFNFVVQDTGTTAWAFFCDSWQLDMMVCDSCGNGAGDTIVKQFTYNVRLSKNRLTEKQ